MAILFAISYFVFDTNVLANVYCRQNLFSSRYARIFCAISPCYSYVVSSFIRVLIFIGYKTESLFFSLFYFLFISLSLTLLAFGVLFYLLFLFLLFMLLLLNRIICVYLCLYTSQSQYCACIKWNIGRRCGVAWSEIGRMEFFGICNQPKSAVMRKFRQKIFEFHIWNIHPSKKIINSFVYFTVLVI